MYDVSRFYISFFTSIFFLNLYFSSFMYNFQNLGTVYLVQIYVVPEGPVPVSGVCWFM